VNAVKPLPRRSTSVRISVEYHVLSDLRRTSVRSMLPKKEPQNGALGAQPAEDHSICVPSSVSSPWNAESRSCSEALIVPFALKR
jgi:hypothetical protein